MMTLSNKNSSQKKNKNEADNIIICSLVGNQ